MKRRLLFLGVDCLDLGLVLRWRMQSYIVGSYGYHFVGHDLYTPVIWAKMLTGIDVTKPPYRFNSKTISRKKRLATLYYLKDIVSKLLNHALPATTISNNKVIRQALAQALQDDKPRPQSLLLVKMLRRASMMERMPSRLRHYSIPWRASRKGMRVHIIEFPPFNDEIYSFIRNLLYFFIDSPPSEKKAFLDYIWSVTVRTAEKTLEAIGRYDVIYWYTPYVDTASHMYYRPHNLRYMLLLRQAYVRTAQLVARLVNEATSQGYDIIVASDHGFNPRIMDHSHYGFWSTSFKPQHRPQRAEDLALVAAKRLGL